MSEIKLREFKVSTKWWNMPGLWGGSHTLETDPTQRRWRAASTGPSDTAVIVGRPGVRGCFFAALGEGGEVEVTSYDATPEETNPTGGRSPLRTQR